jgi:hypothetical protein
VRFVADMSLTDDKLEGMRGEIDIYDDTQHSHGPQPRIHLYTLDARHRTVCQGHGESDYVIRKLSSMLSV